MSNAEFISLMRNGFNMKLKSDKAPHSNRSKLSRTQFSFAGLTPAANPFSARQ